jgi:hypothetical protein
MSKVDKNIKVGYSENINDATFLKKNEKGFGKNQQIIFIILFALTIIAIILVGIFNTHDVKGALIISLLTLFVGTVFFCVLRNRQKMEMTYDGVIKVVEKKVEPYKKTMSYLRTLIAIQTDDGREYIYNNIISSKKNDYTTYYKEGDKVRHHDGFNLPEKYDKTCDDRVVCILCGELVDIQNDRCSQCGKTLLK